MHIFICKLSLELPLSTHQLCNPASSDLFSNLLPAAKVFNDYFGSVFALDDNIMPYHITIAAHNSMPNISFVDDKIKLLQFNIKSFSAGPDNFYSLMFKNLVNKAYSLFIIFY